jgi:hypothetical protein
MTIQPHFRHCGGLRTQVRCLSHVLLRDRLRPTLVVRAFVAVRPPHESHPPELHPVLLHVAHVALAVQLPITTIGVDLRPV